MMIFFRLLLFVLLTNTLSADDPWILPRSTSFHHVLELLHARINIPNPSFSFTLPSLLSLVTNGTTCHEDLLLLLNGFIKQEKWALKIIDSWGTKPPVGILEGAHLWLGSYDECLHSLYLPTNRSHAIQPYSTRYCTMSSPNNVSDDNPMIVQTPTVIIGLCLPKSCHANDFQISFLSIRCESEKRHLEIGALITLSLIILLSLFVCFASFIPSLHEYSFITTLKKVFSLQTNNSSYSFLNGIRVISLLWIILGHSYLFHLTISDNIVHVLDNIHNSFGMQLLLGAVFGVDTFFFISGFLAVLAFHSTFEHQGTFQLRHLFLYYFHRYCRLIPTLVFVLLVSMHLSPWMGQGPIYPSTNGFEAATCRHRWWTTIFFLNNIISPTESCLPVTWYIANDFQFHLLAPILLIPFLMNRRRLTYFLLSMILLANIITTISIISTHPGTEYGMGKDTISIDFFEKVYIAPWCRIGAFIIGMMTKLIIEESRSNLSSIKMIICTTISILLAMLCIFFPFYFNHFPNFVIIIYQSLSRQCWSIVIGWVIYACYINQGGLVTKILSWPFWTILARLSYSAYLIHTIIILVQVYNRLSTIHYQTSIIFNSFISQTILTLFASLFVVILVETPCSLLEKRLRKYHKDKREILANRRTYGTMN